MYIILEIPNFTMEVDNDAKLNKKTHLKEYIVKLTKEELTPNLILDMVNLSKSGLSLASIRVTNFINEVLPESITTND